MTRLKLESCGNRQEMIYAVEGALLLGFQTESAEFPVVSAEGEIMLPKSREELQALWRFRKEEYPEGYLSALERTGEVFELDFRREKGLEYLFLRGGLLEDSNGDMLADRLNVKFLLPEEAEESLVRAACSFAFRLGMETSGYEGPLVAEEGWTGNAVIFEKAEKPEIWMEEQTEFMRIHVCGQGEELEQLAATVCGSFPQLDGLRSWRDALMEMTDDFVMRGADGQLAALRAAMKENVSCQLYGAPEITEKQKAHFPDAAFFNYKSGTRVYEKEYRLPWEAEVFENLMEEAFYPLLKEEESGGHRYKIEGALSESREVREKIADRIRETARTYGADGLETELVCAYKQGYSWLTEVVIPQIKESGYRPDRLEIFFKPFLPEGETVWVDENGATPSYHNLNADNPEKWYDLPIRYLQELYPVQDIILQELCMTEEQVVFLPYEGEKDLTYLCRVYEEEAAVLEQSYRAYCSERPYLDSYPGLGKVHPATGYLRIIRDGEEIYFQRVKTDLEEIWDIYQSQVLPDCTAYIEEKNGGVIHEKQQPFFSKLLLDVTVSEPDYRTGCREDMISSLDALHEDMYFAGSDYFKNYGIRKADAMLDAPGLILPQIHNAEGKPVFRVTLFGQSGDGAGVVCDGTVLYGQRERSQAEAKISRLALEDGKLAVTVKTCGVPDEILAAYAELLEKKVLEFSDRLSDCRLYLEGGGESFCAEIRTEVPEKDLSILDIDLHENELIGYETYLEIIGKLKRVPGIEVFRTAVSYAGREIYAVWLKPEYKGYLSMTKRLSRVPSEIINGRHHANEVSATNAAFILLKKLLTDEKYRSLPDKMNLVIVPMENVDGAAIHYELQKEHPYWKFHVARFNSLGKEFYHEHFKQDTIHSEAMGLTRLYERFLPDILVDNHGVPSHEWEQQFAGYTSPSYKGFWLPRSLLYGYFWYVTNPEYAGNYKVNKVMEDVIADEIARDSEMSRWNKEWSAQFEKYAHAWLPKLFPADYYKDMINYWIPFAADPAHRYPSIRYPWITTVAYTSEVADETAQGDYLNLCARAHVAHDEATLQMLMKAKNVFACDFVYQKDKIFAEYLRQRPLIVEYSGEINTNQS